MFTSTQRLFLYATACIQQSLARAVEFSAGTLIEFLVDLIWYFSQWLTLHTVYQHVGNVGGLSEAHYYLFLCFVMAVDTYYMMFFAGLLENLRDNIYNGQLDFLMLKPMSLIFQMMWNRISTRVFLNVLFSVSFAIWTFKYFDLSFPLENCFWSFFAFVMGFFVQLNIILILGSSGFWTTQAGYTGWINGELSHFGQRPEGIYGKKMQILLYTFIPVLLYSAWPCRLLVYPSSMGQKLYPVIIVAAFSLLTRWIWKKGIRKYEGLS